MKTTNGEQVYKYVCTPEEARKTGQTCKLLTMKEIKEQEIDMDRVEMMIKEGGDPQQGKLNSAWEVVTAI